MLYISLEYILSSIQQLKNVHTFIGITFLTCKKNKLPIGKPVTFPINFSWMMFIKFVRHPVTIFSPIKPTLKSSGLHQNIHQQVFRQSIPRLLKQLLFMTEMGNPGHGPRIMFNESKKLLFQNLKRECPFSLWLFGL